LRPWCCDLEFVRVLLRERIVASALVMARVRTVVGLSDEQRRTLDVVVDRLVAT
jgi:hypothetical protein